MTRMFEGREREIVGAWRICVMSGRKFDNDDLLAIYLVITKTSIAHVLQLPATRFVVPRPSKHRPSVST